MQHPQFNDKDLRIINFCRLYLHVTTISEMFDATGERILPHIKRCERSPWFDPQLNVTIQKRPSEYQIWTRWQPLCAHIATLSQFGPWKLPLRLRRETYCHHTDNTIKQFYHWHCGKYWECTNPEPASHQVQLNLIALTNWAPSSATAVPFQATAQVLTRIYANPSISARFTTSQSNAHHPTFRDHIRSLDHWAQQLLSNVTWKVPQDRVTQILTSLPHEVPLLVVSDGSLIETQHMSFGVTIGTITGDILVELSGVATGPPSSHRAESTGCLAYRHRRFQIPTAPLGIGTRTLRIS
jgi:hypothetical protein